MAQFLRPDSNVTQTGFTGGYLDLRESSPIDTSRALTAADNTSDVLEVGLGDPSATPGAGTTTFRYRIAKLSSAEALDGGGDTVTVTPHLYQGTTLIASGAAQAATGSWATISFNPSTTAVTDWTNLRIRFNVNYSGAGGSTNRRRFAISWAELEVPDAAPPGGKIKVRIGSSWVAKPVKVRIGSSWVEKPLKRWSGSAWVLANS